MTSTPSGEWPARVYASAVVYVGDDADLFETVQWIDGELAEAFEHHEVVLVDDAIEPDPSRALAATCLSGQLVHIRLARRHGLDQAMAAGLTRAIGDFVFEVDDPKDRWPSGLLRDLYARCAGGVDIIAATPGRPPWIRRAVFGMISRWSRIEMGGEVEPLRLVSRRALNAMLALPERFRYRPALYAATGYPRESVVVPSLPRGSRRRPLHNLGRAVDVAVSLTNIGSRLAIYLALAFVLLATAFGIYTAAAYLLLDDVERGWTTIMLLISSGLAGIFLVLALLGEYASRLIAEVLQHPLYVVRHAQVIHGAGDAGGDPPLLRLASPPARGDEWPAPSSGQGAE